METFMEDLVIMAIYLLPLLTLLVGGGALTDFVLDRCPRVERFIERVFDIDLEGDDDD